MAGNRKNSKIPAMLFFVFLDQSMKGENCEIKANENIQDKEKPVDEVIFDGNSQEDTRDLSEVSTPQNGDTLPKDSEVGIMLSSAEQNATSSSDTTLLDQTASKQTLDTKQHVEKKKKQFKCKDCEKSFTQQAHLSIHERKHTYFLSNEWRTSICM